MLKNNQTQLSNHLLTVITDFEKLEKNDIPNYNHEISIRKIISSRSTFFVKYELENHEITKIFAQL